MSSPFTPRANPQIVELVEHVARLLTKEELDNLTLNTRTGVQGFNERMLSRYACFHFVTSLERAKEKAEWIVKMYRPIITPDPRLNRLFLEKFRGTIFVS